MSVNQRINAAIADGMIASIALSGSLLFVISGNTTNAKNVMNSALRIILERKGEAINTAVFVLKAFVSSSIHWFLCFIILVLLPGQNNILIHGCISSACFGGIFKCPPLMVLYWFP